MSIDDEITMTDEVVQAARRAAAEHLQRATEDLHIESAALARYEDFLDATVLVAEANIGHCRNIASALAMPASVRTHVVQGIMEGVRESVRAMYVAMTLVEHLGGIEGQRGRIARTTEDDAIRSCSFCGKTENQVKIAAGPAANICATCTRLVCGVLGIGLSDPSAT